MRFRLAQVNIAIARYKYIDSEFAGFVDNLDRIYELAEHSAGFVWRYVSEDEDAEAKRIFGNDALIFNMSMWNSLQDLRNRDITFSQPMSTSGQVADEIVNLCMNDKRERSMPPISGALTTLSYLFPWLGRKLQPILDRRGRKVKRKLKAEMAARARSAKA